MRIAFIAALCTMNAAFAQTQDASRAEAKLPPYYVIKSKCIPNRGYVALAEAPGHPVTLPMLGLFVYEGEVIGALFEAHERDGWRPWYNEKEGDAVSHDGGPRHYSHTIMFKKGPTAEQCKAARGPLG